MGKSEDLKRATLSSVAATIARIAKKEKVKTLAIRLPILNDNPGDSAGAIAEGLILALHTDNRFKSEPEEEISKLETVDLLGLGEQETAITRAGQIASGVILARELVAAPANAVTPITMAEIAQNIASDHGLDLEIREKEQLIFYDGSFKQQSWWDYANSAFGIKMFVVAFF